MLGSPISHSLSPLIHRTAYALLGIDAQYEAIELTLDKSREFFLEALIEEWTGFSLTMPLKESIFGGESNVDPSPHRTLAGQLFEIDPIAARMKSANTLLRRGDTFFATSTDRTGFIRLFQDFPINSALIIGGGGTARAALGALDGLAGDIHFMLRSPERARSLTPIASHSRLEYFGMDHSFLEYDLIISTTPAGASDQLVERRSHTSSGFRADQIVCDVLYKPYPTKFLTSAQQAGARTFDGIDVLVEQALDQIALFSGTEFDVDPMRMKLLDTARSAL